MYIRSMVKRHCTITFTLTATTTSTWAAVVADAAEWGWWG